MSDIKEFVAWVTSEKYRQADASAFEVLAYGYADQKKKIERLQRALRTVVALETDYPNATVRNMANAARVGLGLERK